MTQDIRRTVGFGMIACAAILAWHCAAGAEEWVEELDVAGENDVVTNFVADHFAESGQPTKSGDGTLSPRPKSKPRTYKTCCHGCLIDWSKFPETIRPFPRLGSFPISPTKGPDYFSLWDGMTGEARRSPPKSGYAPFAINSFSFFDADWRYVEGIDPADRTLVERLKRMHVNDCLMLSTGGEYWCRFMDEHNSRLTTVQNDYLLNHVRLYGDLTYSDWLRVYGEFIWADSTNQALPPQPIDIDRGDITDLFVDLNLFEIDCRPVYVRGGRQELLYGSQRLISPLAWANARRTFQGVKVFRQGEQWDLDAFWVQPVIPRAAEFDTADPNVNFAGGWATYRPRKGEFLDFYYLMLNNRNTTIQQQIVRTPHTTHTVGSRWAGDKEGWLWDFEGMLQFGQQNNSDLFAGAAVAGLGRNWSDAPLKPTLWFYYDYASGGNNHTFNQLFPFGHYYMGWADLIGRQNIHDVNAHLYLYPTPWLTTWIQYHHFWLADSRDALYNAGGLAYRRDATGAAGTDVGDELDFVFNFHLTRYSDILLSYNMFYGGGFVKATAGANGAVNAQSLYLMFQQRW